MRAYERKTSGLRRGALKGEQRPLKVFHEICRTGEVAARRKRKTTCKQNTKKKLGRETYWACARVGEWLSILNLAIRSSLYHIAGRELLRRENILTVFN